jgi:hypothetical protein
LSLKIGQVKKRFSSFIAILKVLFNLSMLANLQTNRLIGTCFIGLVRSIMDFLGKNHHFETFFLALPNNVRLISRMHKNKSSTRFLLIRSRVDVHPGAIGEKRNFARQLWVFFSAMSHVSHI